VRGYGGARSLEQDDQARQSTRAALALAALGVVFGDIGTSPLYAVKETFSPGRGIDLNSVNILGGLSTIFWALMLVVSLKYVVLVMRADNKGEGGTIALLALASSAVRERPRLRLFVTLLGLLGAALFFGETVLTPAISVLSAVEGLKVGTDAFDRWVLPLTVGVLLGLFGIQRLGSGKVGQLFGPVCLLWFVALAASGIWNIAQEPAVLQALNPLHAIDFLTAHHLASFIVLGAVLLALTGAEALYADMGHFGKWPIRLLWFGLVLPALVLNYFGQGALLIADPSAIDNPFYLAFPHWALYPMIALATAATVIASQASISGTSSLARQAVQLGFLPRLNVVQTSAQAYGQVYIPALNWFLLAMVLTAVLVFGSSSELAHAYGVALTGTMLVTSILTFFVIRYAWGLPLWLCVFATGVFVVIDLAFFSSAMLKTLDGGWFPLAIGLGVFGLMTTWRRGREVMFARLNESSVPLEPFLKSLFVAPPQRVPGTAIFMTATPDATPHALLHNLNHNKVLHERVIFLTVEIHDVPWVPFEDRVECSEFGQGCWRMVVRYGFMNRPDVISALTLASALGMEFDMMQTSFFLSRQQIVPAAGGPSTMARWRERLFATMARNAGTVTDYFNIPTNRVIELGTRIEI
jgi:KUP system potassium uptake protein